MSDSKQRFGLIVFQKDGPIISVSIVEIEDNKKARKLFHEEKAKKLGESKTHYLEHLPTGSKLIAVNIFRTDGTFIDASVGLIDEKTDIKVHLSALGTSAINVHGKDIVFERVFENGEKETLIFDDAEENNPAKNPPAPDEKSKDQDAANPPKAPSFKFRFGYDKDGSQVRTDDISVEAETREYAWRAAAEIAAQKATDGETPRFIGDVTPEAAQ